jgi:hypothetical protein
MEAKKPVALAFAPVPLLLEVDRLIGMADFILADFQVFITIGNLYFWAPIWQIKKNKLLIF